MADWHEEYKRSYAKLKESGKSFFPFAVFKDTLVAFLILCLLVFLSYHFGVKLEDLADPTDATYNPRPEWYFLFLFQALKFFPGKLEPVAAVLLPGLGFVALLLVPFFDVNAARHPLERPFWTGAGVFALMGIGYLTWAGFRSPMTNPTMEKDPLVTQGKRLYRDLNCAYCHRIDGKGGSVGPQLDRIAGNMTEEELATHFRDPRAVTPGSVMPRLNLLDDEIRALSAYVLSLGGGGYTQAAPKLFADHCAACHKIGKEGSDVGPDLSLIGSARDIAYIKKYILDPARLNPAANMPSFKGQMTDVEIEDLSRYVAAQK